MTLRALSMILVLSALPGPRVAFHQGLGLYLDGEYEDALFFLEIAAKKAPKPIHSALCAMARIRLGMLSEGADDLNESIRLNEGDAGRHYRPSSGRDLSEADIEHGIEQMRRLLRDRPVMNGNGIGEDDPLFLWAARKFAGEDLPWTIDWSEEPPEIFNAQNLPPTSDRRGWVQIAAATVKGPEQGKERSFDSMWASLVFELHNIANAERLTVIREKARNGEIGKEEYVWSLLETEYRAAQKTRAFYASFYLPWLRTRGESATVPESWKVHLPPTFGGYKRTHLDRQKYPWVPYADYYDELRPR